MPIDLLMRHKREIETLRAILSALGLSRAASVCLSVKTGQPWDVDFAILLDAGVAPVEARLGIVLYLAEHTEEN